MIEIKDVHKTYNLGKSNAFTALKGVNLTIRDGEMVLHSPVAEKKTEEELKMLVDSYFDLLEKCGQAVKRGD